MITRTDPFTRQDLRRRANRMAMLLLLSFAESALLIAGPIQPGPSPTPSVRQEQVASVHVAVTSVRPWEEYVDALQPKFDLTPAGALAKVAEATRLQDSRTFDGLGVSLKAEIGETLGGTNAEVISAGNLGVASGRAAGLDSALKSLTNPVPVASSLHYLAATALYQEVQLINRAFRDAVEFESFTPYVVRLQLTVMPRKRQAPYDVISDLSLQVGEPQLMMRTTPENSAVKVVPMLVTDSIESALHSQSEERLRSLSLALAAVLPKASVGAGLDRVKDAINSMVGRDYNAMFTVARLTDGTVRCRIGALAQSTGGFGLVPQNHSVTLLVFVSNSLATNSTGSSRQLRLIANNSLVSVKTGDAVRQLTNNDFIRRIRRFFQANQIEFCRTCKKPEDELAVMAELFATVARNDFAEFINLQAVNLTQPGSCPGAGVLFPDALWSELTAIWATSQFAVAQFELPKRPEDNTTRLARWRETAGKMLLAVDDGEVMTITLPGFPRLKDELVMARLAASDVPWLNHLVAGPGPYNESASSLTFQFPSPALFPKKMPDQSTLMLELDPQPKQRSTLSSPPKAYPAWTISAAGDTNRKVVGAPIPLSYLPIKKAKPDPKPGFRLFASTSTIVMDKSGAGTVTFAIQDLGAGSTVSLAGSIDGATLAGIKPTAGKVKADALQWMAEGVTSSEVVTFSLEGLNPKVEVQIGASNTENKAPAGVLKFKVILPEKGE